ncbi:Abi family protein [Glutamicibacter creatinolyticus]|uniref:Abi family protein n=1 Tax=Glutamicibacter creatinolyticus TaxID=162496 RepID=UPI0031D3B7A5
MTTPNNTYAKPFLTVPEQIRRLRGRGMDCGDNAYAAEVLQRYGYYRLSGYWHLYRDRPAPPAPRFDEEDREIRLDTFVPGTGLAHVVSLYEFDHELRMRLGDALSIVETAFRFFIGHRLGRIDAFAHRHPGALGATRQEDPGAPPEPTAAYREWLEEYDRHEQRARGDFVVHFRQQYGPHLPIWVATEVMSFGVLSSLYDLMLQPDQEILAARFQVRTADGHGDRGALGNWLNNLRNVRNICAHYGRVWNRAFDVLIDAPGQARKDADDLLASLAEEGTNNRLYGVLLVLRHLLLSIAPEKGDVVDLADFVEEKSRTVGFGMEQLGFPDSWRSSPIWDRAFALDRSPMMAASLLDRAECMTAAETRASLTGAEVIDAERTRTPSQAAREEGRPAQPAADLPQAQRRDRGRARRDEVLSGLPVPRREDHRRACRDQPGARPVLRRLGSDRRRQGATGLVADAAPGPAPWRGRLGPIAPRAAELGHRGGVRRGDRRGGRHTQLRRAARP